jgi:glycosyltransferase involved in cell wall biosynthesis
MANSGIHMKLIIQIPCYNEEENLPITLADLPLQIDGIDEIEILVIDDGSTDDTATIAHQHGVHHITTHKVNKGLAAAFQSGLNACLQQGADVIVNTDADNQYPGRFIPDLIQPILKGNADMVIGNRQTDKVSHFSAPKKLLQRLGSAVVRYVSQTEVPDAPSGFRALSRETALRINIATSYTYTLETIIQAGNRNLTISHVPIEVNPQLRESRLMRSIPQYVWRSGITILHLFMLYKPLQSFTYISLPFFTAAAILWVRYLYIYLFNQPERGANIQSVIVGAVAIILGFVIFLFGLIGELIAVNRRLHEETLYYLKRQQLDRTSPPDYDNQSKQKFENDPQQAMESHKN